MKKSLFLGIVIYMYEWYFCKKKYSDMKYKKKIYLIKKRGLI